MAGADKDELNEIRIALTNISDETGKKALNGIERDEAGDVRIEHRPDAADEIAERMGDHGYERRERLSEGAADERDDAATGHVVTVFTREEA